MTGSDDPAPTGRGSHDAARTIREFAVYAVLEPIARQPGVPGPRLRATFAASQLMGFALLRYVLQIEPLASASHDQIVAAYAPTVQRYLAGPR